MSSATGTSSIVKKRKEAPNELQVNVTIEFNETFKESGSIVGAERTKENQSVVPYAQYCG